MHRNSFIATLASAALCSCSSPTTKTAVKVELPEGPKAYALPESVVEMSPSGRLLGLPFSWDDRPAATVEELSRSGNLASDRYAFDKKIAIGIDGKKVSVEGTAEGVRVTSVGGCVSISSSAEGVEYVFRGKSDNSNIRIKSDKAAKLTLDGLHITSKQGEAIKSEGKAPLIICCAQGTVNRLEDRKVETKSLKEDKFKACVSSEGTIILTGKGSLTVCANHKNGISTESDLVVENLVSLSIDTCASTAIKATEGFRMTGGTVSLTPEGHGISTKRGDIDIEGGFVRVRTAGIASKALKSDSNIKVGGGELRLLCSGQPRHTETDYKPSTTIRTDSSFIMTGGLVMCYTQGDGGKGINADGEVRISGGRLLVVCEGKIAGSDFICSLPKGIKADGNVVISGGDIAVRATGGEGSEGIESKDTVKIMGGNVTSVAHDDAINAKSSIFVAGGKVVAYSLDNDGFDSNGTLTFKGGVAISAGAHMPEEGFDTDERDFEIEGGLLFGIGGGTSIPTESNAGQGSLILGSKGRKDDIVDILDENGDTLFHYRLDRDYAPMTVLFSCQHMSAGSELTISHNEPLKVKLKQGVTTAGETPAPPKGMFGMPPVGGNPVPE